jgi:anti-sigma regulatory factor (Ser/Thr protein kinase)
VGALLTDAAQPIAVRDEAAVSQVREAVRAQAATLGMTRDRAERLVAAASEIAHNQIAHARAGEVLVRAISRRGVAGVEVVARDRGPGIADPTTALRGQGQSSGDGLGVGLGAAYRMADELDFDVRPGEGTTIRARKMVSPIPRAEVAILGRPCAGESRLGDDATFAWDDGGLTCALADGLGHGELARLPAEQAMAVVAANPLRPLADQVRLCWDALGNTRGAVLSLVRIDERAGQLHHAGVGNVTTHLYRGRVSARFAATPGVVGKPGPRARLHEDMAPLGGRHVLLMFSDGLSSRLDLATDGLLREPPLVIAHRLLTEHGRSHDDALVLVATG